MRTSVLGAHITQQRAHTEAEQAACLVRDKVRGVEEDGERADRDGDEADRERSDQTFQMGVTPAEQMPSVGNGVDTPAQPGAFDVAPTVPFGPDSAAGAALAQDAEADKPRPGRDRVLFQLIWEGLHFLNADDVSIFLLEPIQEAISCSSTDSVYIPRRNFDR